VAARTAVCIETPGVKKTHERLVSRRVNAERIVVLSWSRAILLQLAHPLVAAGVAEHSSFRHGRLTAARRLHQTIRAMLALTFGDDAGRTRALDGIRAIHRRVNGRLPEAAGIFPAGTPYSAEDPDLVLWVHATLLESIPQMYGFVVEPLTPAARDTYCDEAAPIAIDLGARPADVPRTQRDLERYLDRAYASGTIAVSAQARELAETVLAPPFASALPLLPGVNRLVTIGLLPEAIRTQYGFAWSDADDRRLARVLQRLRTLRRATPRRLAWWPEGRRLA
jgi:uncharacterized protein (DUF2236 family)